MSYDNYHKNFANPWKFFQILSNSPYLQLKENHQKSERIFKGQKWIKKVFEVHEKRLHQQIIKLHTKSRTHVYMQCKNVDSFGTLLMIRLESSWTTEAALHFDCSWRLMDRLVYASHFYYRLPAWKVCQAFDTSNSSPFVSKWQTTNCQSWKCTKMLWVFQPRRSFHISLLLQFPAHAKLETVIISP